MRIRLGVFCLLLFVFTWGAWAQSPRSPQTTGTKMKGLIINANESSRDTEADTFDLSGNVQIIFKDQHLACDRARINFRSKTIDAQGGVLLIGPKATVGGERIYLDYESNTGVIYSGYVQSGNVFFEGDLLTRTSETDYIAENAKFTTCTNCPESWSFSGQRIRAELGGYAYIKNSIMKFGGWPMLWLPYLVVPLKSDRQTGLLTPEFEQSREGGLTISQSVFWAINRSQDLTWTLKNYELRGLKNLFNYQYVLSENSQGELNVGTLPDRVFSEQIRQTRLKQNRTIEDITQSYNRWFLKYEHYYELPDGYIHRMQLNNASDLQYPNDFPLETRNQGDSAMENRMSLTKNNEKQHYSIDTSYYVNLLQSDPLAGNRDAVHRMPEVRFSQTLSPVPISDLGLLYTADVNYAHFARSDFAYDDMTGAKRTDADRHLKSSCNQVDWYNNPRCGRLRDGRFDPETDIIRTGQRMDFTGSILRPVKIGSSLDLLPRLSYRETQYKFNLDDERNTPNTNTRRYLRAELSARSLVSRIFGSQGPGSFERIKHEIQPEVTFTTIPWISHPSHPFFGDEDEAPYFSRQNISDADLGSKNSLQFDYNDRVYDRKLITFALTNKLIQKRWVQGNPEYRQAVWWKISQSYDFFQAESRNLQNKQPWSDILSVLKVYFDRVEIYQKTNYFPYQGVSNSWSRFRIKNELGDFFEIGHLLQYNVTPGQPADIPGRTEDYIFSIRKNLSYVDLIGRVIYDENPPDAKTDESVTSTSSGERLKSYGYGARFKLPGECWYVTLTQYRTTGKGDTFHIAFDFLWDGQKKPPLPESMLESFSF